MNRALLPWRRLLPVWLPAVALFLGSGSFYVWQTSDSVGRAAQIRSDIETLETEIRRLERVRDQADDERDAVTTLNGQFERLYGEVFGDLEDRLTNILRAIGSATRQAGLLPGSFSYTAQPDRKLGYTRFGIQFAVTRLTGLLGGFQFTLT